MTRVHDMKKLMTLWHVAGPVMCVLLVACGMELGPAWSAHLGHGQRGTWTVTQVLCSGKGCNDLGTFVSANGPDIRAGIGISRGSSLGVGHSLPAIDTGGDVVYPAGGGPDWLIYTIMAPDAYCALRGLGLDRPPYGDAATSRGASVTAGWARTGRPRSPDTYRGTSRAHQRETCPETVRTAEISAVDQTAFRWGNSTWTC